MDLKPEFTSLTRVLPVADSLGLGIRQRETQCFLGDVVVCTLYALDKHTSIDRVRLSRKIE